jgi:hypothetical protein
MHAMYEPFRPLRRATREQVRAVFANLVAWAMGGYRHPGGHLRPRRRPLRPFPLSSRFIHAWNEPERRRAHFFAAFLNLFCCIPPNLLRFRLRGIFAYLGSW